MFTKIERYNLDRYTLLLEVYHLSNCTVLVFVDSCYLSISKFFLSVDVVISDEVVSISMKFKYEARDIWEAKEMKRMGGKSLPLEWGCRRSTTCVVIGCVWFCQSMAWAASLLLAVHPNVFYYCSVLFSTLLSFCFYGIMVNETYFLWLTKSMFMA